MIQMVNPMAPKIISYRLNFILTVVPLWIIIYIFGFNGAYDYRSTANDAEILVGSILISSYIAFISSQIVVAVLISKMGLGKETRRKILWRHTALVTTWCTCNLFLPFCILTNQSDLNSKWYVKLMQALFYSQGFLMPLIRMAEPGSLKMHLKLLRRLVTCKHIVDKDDDDI